MPAGKHGQDIQSLFVSKFSFVGRCCKELLPIEAQSTEARNSSSQVSMNDVTGTGRGSVPSLVVYDTNCCSQCLWMSQGQGLSDALDWLSAGIVSGRMRWDRFRVGWHPWWAWHLKDDFGTILSFLFWHQTFRAQLHQQIPIYCPVLSSPFSLKCHLSTVLFMFFDNKINK